MTEAMLDTLTRRATVWLGPDDASGTQWGSGFFVAPEWVLSCVHVLPRDLSPEDIDMVRVFGAEIDARARLAYWLGKGPTTEKDLLLLRMAEGARSRYCVRLTDRIDMPNRVTAYGYCVTRKRAAPDEWRGDCGADGTIGAYGLTLGGAKIRPGVSGGPALDRDRGVVAGVVKARAKEGGGGLVIAATALRGFEAAVPVGAEGGLGADPYRALIRAHDRWHQENTSWVDAQQKVCAGGERK